MVLFRSCSQPLPPGYEPGRHWLAEFYADTGDMPFPLGTAYITAFPDVAWIDYFFVVEPFRRRGIGTALVIACVQRWPHIQLGTPGVPLLPGFLTRARQLLAHRQTGWSARSACEPWRSN